MLLICCLSLLIVGLDITAVNVALPSIQRDLGAGLSGLPWTVGAYLVCAALCLLLPRTAISEEEAANLLP